MSNRLGRFFGIGVGPGDPELITLKALKLLKEIRVIAVPSAKPVSKDNGNSSRGMAREIVESLLDSAALSEKEFLELYLPMTRDEEELKAAREAAASSLAEELSHGKDVAFVTLGDPMLFSTFSPLFSLIEKDLPGIEILVVPGISSVNASSALLKGPLASSNERVAVLPAPGNMAEVEKALEDFDTVVLLKINSVIDELLELLESKGLTKNAAIVKKVTWPDEEVITDLTKIGNKKVGYFSIMVVRK